MIAGSTSTLWNFSCCVRFLVDSALAGSQDDASLSSMPVSLPANGPRTATTAIQKTTVIHFVMRPVKTPATFMCMRFPFPGASRVPLRETMNDVENRQLH